MYVHSMKQKDESKDSVPHNHLPTTISELPVPQTKKESVLRLP